jgi:predicted amidohydrolase YtcJ
MKHPMRSHAKVRHALSGILTTMPRIVDNLPLPAPHVESHAGIPADVPDNESIELIVDNVRLMDDRKNLVSVAVSGGVIRNIRSPDGIQALDDAQTTVLDGRGNLLLPGFCDSHVHLLVGAERLDGCDLEGATTLDEVAARLRDFIRAHPHRPLYHAFGLAYTTPPILPPAESRTVLDAIEAERPLFVYAHDLHTGWANSKAIQEADLLHPMPPFPPLLSALDMEANIELGPDGLPGGEFREPETYFLVECPLWARYPVPVPRKLGFLIQSMRELQALGLTALHTMGLGLPEEDLETLILLLELEHSGRLGIRVSGSMSVIPDDHMHRDLERAVQVRDLLADGRQGRKTFAQVHAALLELLDAASAPRGERQAPAHLKHLFDHVVHSLHQRLQRAHYREHEKHHERMGNDPSRTGPMAPDGMIAWNTIKLFMDGVVEKDTSFRFDSPSCAGIPAYSVERLTAVLEYADRAGMQVAAHCIGNASVARFLDAVEIVRARHAPLDAKRGHRIRHRIEHIETCRAQDIPRFARLDVVASMQPLHERGPVRLWHQKVPEHEWPTAFPWKLILESGGMLTFGSDWPIVSCNALESIDHATTRRPWKTCYPPAALSPDEALAGFTSGPALTRHAEARRGQIKPGMSADLVLLNATELSVQARVEAAIIKGKVVYDAGQVEQLVRQESKSPQVSKESP